MLRRKVYNDAVTVNRKPSLKNNPLKYFLGKIAPKIFGAPVHVVGTLRDEFGNVKQQFHVYNTITTAGKNGIADQILASPTLGKPTHMAIGTGTGGTTALTTEIDRNALTSKTRSAAVVTLQGDWPAGDGTGSLTEAGIFDAASAGNMWNYTSFGVVTKAASDVFQIVWTITIA